MLDNARAVRASAVLGSPAFPTPSADVAERAGLAYDRSHDTAATTRQAVATVASGDRTERLRALDVPALVLHGLADTLCDPSGGRATAAAIPGAELVLIVEVRARGPGAWTSGLGSLNHAKRERIRRAGQRLWRDRYKGDPTVERLRFDAASVRFDGARADIDYVVAAF